MLKKIDASFKAGDVPCFFYREASYPSEALIRNGGSTKRVRCNGNEPFFFPLVMKENRRCSEALGLRRK